MSDEMIPMFKEQCEVSQSSMTYNAFDIYLDEEIKDPTYYRHAFQVLRSAQQGDLVRIYISSVGGNLNSAVMFKNAIESCQAEVVAIIEAEAYSAASLIALCCSQIEVKKHATMMCHSAAFGSGGIVQNVRDHVDFVGKHAEAIMYEVYQDFLNPEELEDLRRGREIWLDHTQIGERLDVMFEARNSRPCDCEHCQLEEGLEDDIEEMPTFEEMVESAVTRALEQYEKKKADAEKKAARKTKPKSKVVVAKDSVTIESESAVVIGGKISAKSE